MPELLTMQDLANGHLDIKALGEAANGDENTQVVTRTGETYPSAKKAIKTLFENGGLPATPFRTRTLLTASGLTDGQYAQVTDDATASNNGLYYKSGTAWIKSSYDPVMLSKAYTDYIKTESATDAANKAALAESNAKAASALDATSKASNALLLSKSYTDQAQLGLSSDMRDAITADVLSSAQAAIDSAVAVGGYIIVDSFELGATITKRDEVLRLVSNGTFYRWAGDLPKVVPASSTPLTSGGLGSNGWLLIDMSAKGTYNSMFSLLSDKNLFQDGKTYITSSFYTGKLTGYGTYVYMSGVNKSLANGGSIIDPDKMGNLTSTNVQAQLNDYLSKQGTGTGTGCLVKLGQEHTAEMYGGLPNEATFDCSPCFKKIIDTVTAPVIRLLKGNYYVKGTAPKIPAINLPSYSKVFGAGMYLSYLKNMDSATNLSIPIGSYATMGVEIRDFGVHGNKQRLGGVYYAEAENIDFDRSAKNLTIKNIHSTEAMSEGIDIDDSTDLTIDNMYIENCGGNGLHLSDPSPARNCNVSNVTVVNCAHIRGADNPYRVAGVILRASNLNITNLIIKDCYRGLLQDGQLVPDSSKNPININNLHISGSTFEDIDYKFDASGLHINNFTIKRAADNVYPTCIKAVVGKSLKMSQGEIEGTANIDISGNSVFGRTGFSITDVIAPDINLNIAGFGRAGAPWSYPKLNSSTFKDVELFNLYGFALSTVSCDNLNLNSNLQNGTLVGNIVSGNITETAAAVSPRKVTIIGNRVGGTISSTLASNIHVQMVGNIVG